MLEDCLRTSKFRITCVRDGLPMYSKVLAATHRGKGLVIVIEGHAVRWQPRQVRAYESYAEELKLYNGLHGPHSSYVRIRGRETQHPGRWTGGRPLWTSISEAQSPWICGGEVRWCKQWAMGAVE